jgi:hypothetical protein
MWRILVLVAGLAACGDNKSPNAPPKDDAGVTPDGDGPATVGPCLDRPTDLDRPPTGQLPCELLPPGFVQP